MSSEIQKRLLPLPEKPIQPSILKRHLWVFFPTPRTANERLVDITAKSLFFGFYAGVIRCWWLDYKKATTTPPRESIRFLRTKGWGPFSVVSTIGITYGLTRWAFEIAGYEERNLRQQVICLATTGAMYGLLKRNFQLAALGAFYFGGIGGALYWMINTFFPILKQRHLEKITETRVAEFKEPPPHPFDIRKDKFIYSYYIEDNTGAMRAAQEAEDVLYEEIDD